jgi:hypothetical protein
MRKTPFTTKRRSYINRIVPGVLQNVGPVAFAFGNVHGSALDWDKHGSTRSLLDNDAPLAAAFGSAPSRHGVKGRDKR